MGRARGMGREEREGVFDWGGWEERVDGWGVGMGVVQGKCERLGRKM